MCYTGCVTHYTGIIKPTMERDTQLDLHAERNSLYPGCEYFVFVCVCVSHFIFIISTTTTIIRGNFVRYY